MREFIDSREGFSDEERLAYEQAMESDQICRSDREQDTEASRAFAAAFDDPEGFDFGMEAERADSGFANFGFDPAKAAELREAEEKRMAEAQQPILKVGTPIRVSGHPMTVLAIEKDGVKVGNAERDLRISHHDAMVALEQTLAATTAPATS